jgi:hypothetical protein
MRSFSDIQFLFCSLLDIRTRISHLPYGFAEGASDHQQRQVPMRDCARAEVLS